MSAFGPADGPAIELRLFGGLSVRGSDGVELSGSVMQPKRTALLAYLAIAAPHGFHQRDTLVGLLWPDLEQERARAALSQSLYLLKQALGRDVFRTRGNDEIALAADAVSADVLQFEEALAAGRSEEALALYGGDLLAGFHVSGVPAFEQWLEGERARLSQSARRAAWLLVDDALDADDGERAIEWANRAYALAAHDEGELRRLIATYADAEDIAGALRTYGEYATWLRQEYDAEPARATRDLVDRLRVRSITRTAIEPAASSPEAASVPSATVEITHATRARRTLRPLSLAAVAVTVAVLVIAGSWTITNQRTAPAPAVATRVAVLPFVVRGRPDLEYLQDGMVDLLSARLDGAGPIRTVDAHALLHYVRGGSDAGSDPSQAGAVAARFNAGLYVTGSIIITGGALQATATMYDAAGNLQARAAAEAVNEEGILAMVDELARELLSGQLRGPNARLERAAVLATTSFPALKAYLTGESQYRAGRYAQAFEAYSNAIALDSTFALAHYRVAITADWVDATSALTSSLASAQRHATRLDGRERALINALDLFWNGAPAEMEAAYSRILRTYPDDVDAWYHFGEVLFHWGRMLGLPVSAARPAFERVLTLQPDNGSAAAHLARIAAFERRPTAVDTLVRNVLATGSEVQRTPEMHLLRAYALNDTVAARRLVSSLPNESDYAVWVAAWRVAAYVQNLPAAITIVSTNTRPARSESARNTAWLSIAHFEAARGRWRAARDALAHAEELSPADALETAALLESLPFSPATPAQLHSLQAWISREHARGAAVPLGRWRVVFPEAHRFTRLIAEGLILARLGDTDSAASHLAQVRALAGGPGLAGRLAYPHGLSAAIAHHSADGNVRQATLAELAAPRARHALVWRSAGYTNAFEIFLRAELLLQDGRDEEALGWYASFGDDFSYDVVFLAPASLRMAEIHERAGRKAEAARAYARFVELWRECDPELQPKVTYARARIRALGGG